MEHLRKPCREICFLVRRTCSDEKLIGVVNAVCKILSSFNPVTFDISLNAFLWSIGGEQDLYLLLFWGA